MMEKKNNIAENNHTKNISTALSLVENELNYEERRNEWLNKKAATYIGFSSIVMALMLNDNIKNALEGHIFRIPYIWVYDLGIFLIFISIFTSIYAYRIKSFKRPSVNNQGLLKDEIIEQDNQRFEQTIIKHYSKIIESTAEVNQTTAATIKRAAYFFVIGMFLIMISFFLR